LEILFLLNVVCDVKSDLPFVLVIISKESPTVVSLNVPETFKAELAQQISLPTAQPSYNSEVSFDTTCESSIRVPCEYRIQI
jgi:hypothetical protein